ncbi:MAG TPA: UDP-N-acetylmuramate--L-alanine ligase [Actinomycetota bacterium]|nr:UDP-N-acetylmuramate--L-alanine ligase [Actinomycetota bacterium]
MIGIGGAGMSGIARLLLARRIAVSGSDLKASSGLDDLAAIGAVVAVGHRADQVAADGAPDAVVVSTAIPERNPELEEARRLGIPVLARAQVLAALMTGARGIAVAGTHGKTTTTSMASVILERAGLDPTFVIGGDLNESGSNARHGAGDWFVAEADESDGSFLLLAPEVAIVTNVEQDHVDFYASRDETREAFAQFVRGAGTVVACADDEGVRDVLARAGRTGATRTYGIGPEADVRVSPTGVSGRSITGTIGLEDGPVEVSLRVPGVHNLLNAAAALLAAREAGVEPERAAAALGSFGGVRRRFEFRGMGRGAEFFDDYAHHPTEIRATLAAVPDEYRRVVAVFQPHRYTRTEAMWGELGESLAAADVVVLTDVYGAGESPIPGVTGKLLVESLTEAAPTKRVLYLPKRADVAQWLSHEVRPGDLVLTLGAGDITMVPDEALERILEDG